MSYSISPAAASGFSAQSAHLAYSAAVASNVTTPARSVPSNNLRAGATPAKATSAKATPAAGRMTNLGPLAAIPMEVTSNV
jgi:hypothetical protein